MKTRYLIPLILFIALAGLFYYALVKIGSGEYNPRDVPSPLVGKPAPQFDLPRLKVPDERFDQNVFAEHPVSLFNVWASWCVACRQEHPFLMQLARRNELPIFGLNYKDERPDALNWLRQHGDPYTASAFDHDGRVGIDWGVYGVPETFLVDREGRVRYKHIGPINRKAWQEKFLPIIEQIEAEQE